MTKLKTLKDFESFPSKIELKQEAIKWVKNFDKEWGILSIVDTNFPEWYTIDMQLKFKQEYEKIISVAVKSWVKHFFNLTEEDL